MRLSVGRLFCVEGEDEEEMRGGLFIGRACWLDGVASDSELRGRDAVVERLQRGVGEKCGVGYQYGKLGVEDIPFVGEPHSDARTDEGIPCVQRVQLRFREIFGGDNIHPRLQEWIIHAESRRGRSASDCFVSFGRGNENHPGAFIGGERDEQAFLSLRALPGQNSEEEQ